MNSYGYGDSAEYPTEALEQTIATLQRLADVGGPLGTDEQRSRAGQPSPTDEKSAMGPLVEFHERQLRLAEARYRGLIEQIPAVTFIASLTGDANEIYVSPQIETLLGFTQEEWVSDPILWYTQTHPNDRERLSSDFATAIMTGQPFRGVIRVFTREGVMRWVQMEARFVRDEHGLPVFLQGAGFDVTEQYRAQEARERLVWEQAARAEAERERQRLQDIFTTLPAAIAIVSGPDHIIEFLNPVALKLTGSGAALIGKRLIEAFPELGEEATRVMDKAIANGQPCVLQEYRTSATPLSEDRYFNVLIQTLPGSDDRGIRLLIYAVDVTAQVLARQDIERALNLREEALTQMRATLRMREGFLASAAHDLKTPVASIKGRSQLIKRQLNRLGIPRADRLLESITAIESSATRMTAMIDELLDLARLQSGQPLDLERRPIDLVGIVQQAVADHQQRTNRHRIRLKTLDNTLVGNWDPIRVSRVIGNLLDNAIKYSPEGGEIVVTVGRDTQTPNSSMFQVKDSGVGISEADLPRIFERFYRGTNVVGRIAGTGIGLSGSYEIVRAHGGEIEVASEEGAGTTFTVRLPVEES